MREKFLSLKFSFVFISFFVLFLSCQENASVSEVVPSSTDGAVFDERANDLVTLKKKLVPFFEPMRVREGDWLKSFSEPGQTFEQYLSSSPTLPTEQRSTIYIQPMGEFSETQMRILRLTGEYMKAFYGLPVRLEETKSLGVLPVDAQRRNPSEGHKQIKTGYFLDVLLPKLIPEDAAAFICFTNFDLYPDENWNYLFGQANLKSRVGVWSLFRFGNPDKNPQSFDLVLKRTLKLAMHETGHMFGMEHCTKFECLMSGTNHVGETDRRPIDNCPECFAKLVWAMKYEPSTRYRNLTEFCKRNYFTAEAELFDRKLKAIDEASE